MFEYTPTQQLKKMNQVIENVTKKYELRITEQTIK